MSTTIETPTQRRSKQIDYLAATSRDLATVCSISAKADTIKRLTQPERAALKKRVEQSMKTLKGLAEGIML